MQRFMVKDKVNEFVKTAALSSQIKAFYPAAVATYANTSVDIVFPELLGYVATGELELNWQLRCPNLDCINIIAKDTAKIGDEEMCNKCGNEFEVTQNDLFPIFAVTKEYKDYVLDQYKEAQDAKKKSGHLPLKASVPSPMPFSKEWLEHATPTEMLAFFAQTPQNILTIFNITGEQITMGNNNRTIGDMSGNNLGNNNNFMGDNVEMNAIGNTTVLADAMRDLEMEIRDISDSDKKEDAEVQYDLLEKYIEKNQPSKIERTLKALAGLVSTTTSILTIASQFGITFP
jgi:hypothetical protein